MKQIIDGKLYDTDNAQLVAHNHYWDGHNWDRNGRNIYLYMTAKKNFFLYHTSRYEGELDYIEPITRGEAKMWYEELPERGLSYEQVFGEAPEEA